jgi:hypothetical protein
MIEKFFFTGKAFLPLDIRHHDFLAGNRGFEIFMDLTDLK